MLLCSSKAQVAGHYGQHGGLELHIKLVEAKTAYKG